MATDRDGGESQVSHSLGSTDTCELHCQPCQLDGQAQDAVGLCTDCQEYLCKDCFDGHTIPRPTRNHTLLTKEQMLQDQGPPTRKDKCSEICTAHKGEIIRYCCMTQRQLGCDVCMTLDHRTCDIIYIPQAAKDLANNDKYKEAQKLLNSVMERCEGETSADFQRKTQQKAESLERECSEAVKKAQKYRKDINETLDKVEADFVTELETMKSEATQRIVQNFDKCKAIQTKLYSLMEMKETCRENEQNCKLFTLMMKTKDLLKSAEENIKEAEDTHVNSQVKFVANKETLETLRHAEALVLDPITAELYSNTRIILDQYDHWTFQTLVSKMQALPIDSEPKLKGVVDLIFEKVIMEPNNVVGYAYLCRYLSMFKVASEQTPREMVNFRAVLLTRFQREFEKEKSSEAMFKEKRGEISKTNSGPKRDTLARELEYEESKAKRRFLGNIRFIGELFQLMMLTQNIMHDCVFKLLRTKDPENLECLCTLLTTIGKELDVDKAKPRMDQYFRQLQRIVDGKEMPAHVQNMLQGVVDLRQNNWVPKYSDNNPKTSDQTDKKKHTKPWWKNKRRY